MERKEKLWSYLIGISVFALIVSNLLAIKLTSLFGIAVDCGILLYPITYIVGDIAVEFFGEKKANQALKISFITTLMAMLFLQLAVVLPAHPEWGGQESYAEVFNFMPRVVIGSVVAYLISGMLNNFVFEKMRQKSNFALRALGSSAVAHLADSLIFETIAFIGVLPFGDFVKQAALAYVLGLGVETLLFCFVTNPVANAVRNYLKR